MNDWIKKAVAAFFAGVGVYLVAWGAVSPEAWATTVSPDFIASVAGVVGVCVYGVINKVSDYVWHVVTGSQTETTSVTSNKDTGEVTSVTNKTVGA